MSFLSNLKISVRIALSLVLPIAGLLFFSGYVVMDNRNTVTEMEKLQSLAELAPVIGAVVHELQKERGRSAVFIGSKGKKFADKLPVQRDDTNAKIGDLDKGWDSFDPKIYNLRLADKVAIARSALSELNSKRDGISKLELTVPQMAKYYTPTIGKLLAIIEEMALLSSNAKIANLITAYTSFLQGKERAGVERAMGGGGFGAGKFSPGVYNKFVSLVAQQNTYFGIFNNYGSSQQSAFFKKTISGPDVEEVARMRKIAIESTVTNDLQGIEGPYWFTTITNKINLMKQVEDKIASDLLALTASIHDSAQSLFYTMGLVTLGLLIITAALVTVIVRGITVPIAAMTSAMTELAEGNNDLEIPSLDKKDEIGEMAQAVQVFKETAIRTKQLEAEEIATAERQKVERKEMMNKMADEFENSVGGIVQSVSSAATELETSSNSMSSTATQTSEQATTVASASMQAAANVETVSAAAEELSSSISEISNQVSQSSIVAKNAVEKASVTHDTIQELAQSATKISEVVSLITDIAEQTNLLALNATIEAARAGDAGKGFAVVASEVKNLATQTARATEEISAQIDGVQKATQESVTAIQDISKTIGEIDEIASSIASAVEEQGAATQEIARNVEQAAAGTTEVSSTIQNVTQSAGESGEAASQIQGASQELSQQSTLLKVEVDKFLDQVRLG